MFCAGRCFFLFFRGFSRRLGWNVGFGQMDGAVGQEENEALVEEPMKVVVKSLFEGFVGILGKVVFPERFEGFTAVFLDPSEHRFGPFG